MTVKLAVAAGSAVAVKPVSSQAWLPWSTVMPTGRPVRRRLATAERSAASNDELASSRYRASTKCWNPAVQPCASTPADRGRRYRLRARIQSKYRCWPA